MKKISVYVPERAVIEAISPAYRLFTSANQFLEASGKKPLFDVEYVGMSKYVIANDGEYSVKINRLIKDVSKTDLVILPAIYGEVSVAIKANDKITFFII